MRLDSTYNLVSNIPRNLGPWLSLIVAGALEILFAVGLKNTEGFTKLCPSLFTLISMTGSLGLLSIALRNIPLGLAYAVWTGIGTVGTAIAGVVMFGESISAVKTSCIIIVMIGIVGLHLGD